jgi:glycosyltransferase involved in cell wall biosynthesis
MARIIIVWGLWGPYHCHRFEALRRYAAAQGSEVIGVSLFEGSRVNQWGMDNLPVDVVRFNLGKDETRFPLQKVLKLLSIPRRLGAEVALLPSYDHWSLSLNAAVRACGGRVVMMNETHAGTARARGLKLLLKKRIVAGFHAAVVGGAPHARYFASMGLSESKIFTGYDAVDNIYFAAQAAAVRQRDGETRRQFGLPHRYFLSVGRFVAKKNLAILIRAYRKFLEAGSAKNIHLVMVGAGEEEPKLRDLCRTLRLPVYDKTLTGAALNAPSGDEIPGVHFYGFRQIPETPSFYALAEAFILPSLYEEWGLVVNEAMASSLPVVVSETAGCAEDLLESNSSPAGASASVSCLARDYNLAKRCRQNGFVFDPNSSDELSRILLLLASSSDLRASMGRASRKIVEKFSCENFARNAFNAAKAALGHQSETPAPARLVSRVS